MGSKIETVSKEDVVKMIDDPSVVIVDVLGKKSYDDFHIRNSISIPLDVLEKGGWKMVDRSKTVVTYCHSRTCNASLRAAEVFQRNGYHSKAYEGGITEWKEHALPAEGAELDLVKQ